MTRRPRGSSVLGIDAAVGPFSAALVDREGRRPPRVARGAGNDALEAGLGLIRDVLGDEPGRDLDRIVVTAGPGSFTGMRIAAAYAKSLAAAWDVPLVAFGSYDALDPHVDGPSLVAIASRAGRANASLRVPGRPPETLAGTYVDLADAVAERLAAGVAGERLAGDGPDVALTFVTTAAGFAPALRERMANVHEVALPDNIACEAAIRGASRDALTTPLALVVEYGEAAYA